MKVKTRLVESLTEGKKTGVVVVKKDTNVGGGQGHFLAGKYKVRIPDYYDPKLIGPEDMALDGQIEILKRPED